MEEPRILIIEDDDDISMVFSSYLVYGLNVEEELVWVVRDGQKALSCLKDLQKAPEFIVLDMFLPNVSGDDLLEYIKSSVVLQDVPVVIVTASPEKAEQYVGKVSYSLVKPISYANIVRIGKELLSLN